MDHEVRCCNAWLTTIRSCWERDKAISEFCVSFTECAVVSIFQDRVETDMQLQVSPCALWRLARNAPHGCV